MGPSRGASWTSLDTAELRDLGSQRWFKGMGGGCLSFW